MLLIRLHLGLHPEILTKKITSVQLFVFCRRLTNKHSRKLLDSSLFLLKINFVSLHVIVLRISKCEVIDICWYLYVQIQVIFRNFQIYKKTQNHLCPFFKSITVKILSSKFTYVIFPKLPKRSCLLSEYSTVVSMTHDYDFL